VHPDGIVWNLGGGEYVILYEKQVLDYRYPANLVSAWPVPDEGFAHMSCDPVDQLPQLTSVTLVDRTQVGFGLLLIVVGSQFRQYLSRETLQLANPIL
jgi:hypothetical protein